MFWRLSSLPSRPPPRKRWPLVLAGLILGGVGVPGAGVARAQGLDPCFNHADGALCSDQNPCTLNDTCQSGWCKGAVAPNGTDCTDGNLCTMMDRCVFGLCVGQTVPEGDPCDDGNMCTTGEACRRGLCTPQGNLQCNDNDPCTSEFCIPASGCVYSEVAMCMPPDAGAGGSGGGGAGGSGGSGPGGSGGSGSGGTAGSGGGNGRDAGLDASDDAPSFDALSDAPFADGAAGQDAQAGRDGGDASVADGSQLPDSVAYKVEGGAWLCAYRPGPGSGSAWPLIVGLTWLWARARRRGTCASQPPR